jgi:ABC-2 type transport system ATP-binding protein
MEMPDHFAIEAYELRKVFGDRVAVRGLTLQVKRGEVFGFLGPNGAGKTTSIKMLLGLITPTSGTGQLLGAPLRDRATLARIGFLPEHFRFQEWLTAREFLEMHGQLLGMQAKILPERVNESLELVGLSEFRHKQLHTFSKGMLQRIGLAQALLNKPDLVFLDEPTSGLDPIGRRLVRDIIRAVRDQGTCVFLNSHLLSEIEVTCDRVAFIRHGEVVKTLELNTLDASQLAVTIRAHGLTNEIVHELSQWGQDIHTENNHVTLKIRHEDDLPKITHYLVTSGVEVYAVMPERLSLEDIFIETIGKEGGL